MDTTVFVYGGWSASAQFNDLHALDTVSLTWSLLLQHGPPRWNHGMVCVRAIPHSKLFVFGGCSGDLNESARLKGAYRNDVLVLDTGKLAWTAPAVTGTAPLPRAECALAYDSKSSRVIGFGGWADRWRSDVLVLDVGSVVGPPYAVIAVLPDHGPITGGTKVVVQGIEFVEGIQVRARGVAGSGARQRGACARTICSTLLPRVGRLGGATAALSAHPWSLLIH